MIAFNCDDGDRAPRLSRTILASKATTSPITASRELDRTIGGSAPLSSATGSKPRLMPDRRFPPLWRVEEQSACFVVPCANRQALGYFLFRGEAGTPLSRQAAQTRRGASRPMWPS